MTLIDTVPGFVATLDALAGELGIDLPAAAMSQRLGPPLDQMLAPYLPADQLGPAGDRFRALYPEYAIAATPALPGAHEALAAVRSRGGRIVVVTGKYAPNAALHVAHLGLDVDEVEGWVWGVEKGPVLRRHGAQLFVGDHLHDIEGAQAAGLPCVGVATGGCTEAELRAAGAQVVLGSLLEFPDWLADFLDPVDEATA